MQLPERGVSLSSPDITDLERKAVLEVLDTRYLSVGPKVQEFEEKFARYVGVRHAVAVNCGTSGLHLCVKALVITEGDEVITTPFSFVASANCLLYERAVPVFVDIDPHTLNIDVAQIEGKITKRTKAILPVHVFGQPCDMEEVLKVAERYDLHVIEDACEAVGAEYKGRKTGTLGDCGVFAFYPNKQMTTGEGGMIVTDRDDWDVLFRSLRNQGRDVCDGWLSHSRLGYNYRMDEMSAALGLAQLGRIEDLLAKRERVAGWYNERLAHVELVEPPHFAPTTSRMSWFVYVVRLAPQVDRSRVMVKLEEQGIPSRPYFTPIHLQPFYRQMFGYKERDFPVTESMARSTLALPFFGNTTEEQVNYVCTTLAEILKHST